MMPEAEPHQQLEEYLEQFTDDENGDGKVHVDVYPIPVSENINDMDYYTGNATKLSAEFQMGEAVMLFTDTRANDYIMASETLTDLSEKYPGHENIQKDGYYLRHTDFATKIDYPGNVDLDLAISLRKPVKTSDSKEKMQETYDVAEKVFLRIMDDLDNIHRAGRYRHDRTGNNCGHNRNHSKGGLTMLRSETIALFQGLSRHGKTRRETGSNNVRLFHTKPQRRHCQARSTRQMSRHFSPMRKNMTSTG